MTTGSFEWSLDGSDVGLTTAAEDIDAVQLLSGGDLFVSTAGAVSTPSVQGADKDILRFAQTQLGANGAGNWSFFFDGSDVALNTFPTAKTSTEYEVLPSQDQLFLSTVSQFTVDGSRAQARILCLCALCPG